MRLGRSLFIERKVGVQAVGQLSDVAWSACVVRCLQRQNDRKVQKMKGERVRRKKCRCIVGGLHWGVAMASFFDSLLEACAGV